ncbi:modulator of apoptosis 1-like [Plakobranchus ocellatus]|uniref:Modulator of apoptosis 1-like n=1 Tax=Plakobranchus ocellatus TaxID=259542 RepID=A0AAV4B732_9GAST|nr:modulator of apoptosis 1-like [Plakobranchus ocellatus]
MTAEDKDTKFGMTKVMPRLPVFTGESKDCSFDQWEFEVQCLIKEAWPEDEVKLLIRRSLRGQASRTLMNLGTDASLATIMAKFKSVYGHILSLNTVMATFYSMKQAETEDAGSFAQRLEDTAHQAVTLGRVEQKELNALLKEAFCAGLKPQTKLITGFLLENKALTFDQLSLEVKRRDSYHCSSTCCTNHGDC